MTVSDRPIRVIQWATGAVGTEMVTTILDHRPDIQLVGARVYSEAKDGVDIGTLVGRAPIGVSATTDVDRILNTDADLVLYAPSFTDLDDVVGRVVANFDTADLLDALAGARPFPPSRLRTPRSR